MNCLKDRIKCINVLDTVQLSELIDDVFLFIKDSVSEEDKDELLKCLFDSIKKSIVSGIADNTIQFDELFFVIFGCKQKIRNFWIKYFDRDFDETIFDKYEFNENSIRLLVREAYDECFFYPIVVDDLEKECGNRDVRDIITYLENKIAVEENCTDPDTRKLDSLRRDLHVIKSGPNYEKALKSWGMLKKNDDNNSVFSVKSHPEWLWIKKNSIKERLLNKLSKGLKIFNNNKNRAKIIYKGNKQDEFGKKKTKKRRKLKKKGLFTRDKSNPSTCKKSVINHGKNKKLFFKSILGISGFISGMALSSFLFPFGVRLVGMGISGVRLISNKFPEGRVARVISNVSESVNKWAEKHPKINAGISSCREFLKKDNTKVFINNMARGYLVGNVVEMFTGLTPFQHMKNLFGKGNNSGVGTIPSEPVVTEPEVEVTEQIVTDPTTVPTEPVLESGVSDSITESVVDNSGNISNVSDSLSNEFSTSDGKASFVDNLFGIDLIIGDIHDVSGLGQGYTSSDGLNLVNLNTSKGTEVIVDKFGTSLSGEAMVHFKQLNGEGYAWFKVSDVKLYLYKIYKLVSKMLGRY